MSDYKVPFVNFALQYQQHKEEYDEAIFDCLNNGKLILQDDVEIFENNLSKFLGMKYAVAVNSGTDALTLAIKAKEILTYSHVSVTGYTFKATYESVKHNGYKPFIKDIVEKPQLGETERMPTGHIHIPVHIEGMVHKVGGSPVLEDACQAIGAKGVGYSGTACYSFYPAKILGGFGDGGAVVTNDKEIADRVRLYRHHWQTDEDEEYGYCSRLDNVQASFLNVKLKYLPVILQRRQEIAEKYKALKGVRLPIYQKGRVWQDYVIRSTDSKGLADYLESQGIQTLGQGMTPPHIALNTGQVLKNTEKLYEEMLRLPCNETLTDEQVDHVIKCVNEYTK